MSHTTNPSHHRYQWNGIMLNYQVSASPWKIFFLLLVRFSFRDEWIWVISPPFPSFSFHRVVDEQNMCWWRCGHIKVAPFVTKPSAVVARVILMAQSHGSGFLCSECLDRSLNANHHLLCIEKKCWFCSACFDIHNQSWVWWDMWTDWQVENWQGMEASDLNRRRGNNGVSWYLVSSKYLKLLPLLKILVFFYEIELLYKNQRYFL